jgi:hypothetical protein
MLHYFLHLFWERVKDATKKGGWVQCEPDCHFYTQIVVTILQLHFVILNFLHLNIGSSCHHELLVVVSWTEQPRNFHNKRVHE